MREAGDVEAAHAEVEDAHRDALTKVTEADRRAAAAERTARLAQARAEAAQRDRDEAESVTQEAIAEAARVRRDAEVEIAATEQRLAAAEAQLRDQSARHQVELEQAQRAANAAQVQAAAAAAGQRAADEAAERDRETAVRLRADLERHRGEARAEREALRADAAEQLAHPPTVLQWRKYKRNSIVRFQHWRHDDGPRPTLCVIHGFMGSPYLLDGLFFSLPGSTSPATTFCSTRCPSTAAGPSRPCTTSAPFLNWLGDNGVDRIALTGISLGGYTSALVASTDDRLQAVIPSAPLVNPESAFDEWFPASKVGSVGADGRRDEPRGHHVFPGGPGWTTTPEEFDSLMTGLASQVFGVYGDDTVVYPGHGDAAAQAGGVARAGW